MHVPIYTIALKKTGSLFSRQEIHYTGRAQSIIPLLRRHLGLADREHHIVVMMDAESRVIGINTAGIGTLTAVQFHPREVFKPAILANAHTIIVCHNHPSGSPDPSEKDRESHAKLKEAAFHLGIFLEDDIILGDNCYFSFCEEEEREYRRKEKERRDRDIAKARSRAEQGTSTRRDDVLLAAERMGKVISMTRCEAEKAIVQIIDDLRPIVGSVSKIRRATRSRAKELLMVAEEMKAAGNYTMISRLEKACILDEPEKTCTVPIVDFIELPRGGR